MPLDRLPVPRLLDWHLTANRASFGPTGAG